MRILAFTDLHAHHGALEELTKRSKQADLILCAGDMSIFGMALLDILEAMNDWGKPVFLIHGNHEDEDILADVNEQFPNLHFVHKQEKEFQNVSVLGWGGGGFARQDPQLEKFAKNLKPKANRIIMFHGPPHGTSLDYKEGFEFTGCKTRRAVVERLQPFLVLCGHIHENFGNQDKIGKSLVLNPGPTGKFINLKDKGPVKKAAKKSKSK